MTNRLPKLHASSIQYAVPSDVVSLHLGYPDPLTFPAEAIRTALNVELTANPDLALQYCEEPGHLNLREKAAQSYLGNGRSPVGADSVLITQGTTESLSLICQMLVRPGDYVLVERPTYVWAIRMFELFGARILGVPTGVEGILPGELRSMLQKLVTKNVRPRFLYVMPDFQNPSGHCMSVSSRVELLSVAAEHRLTIVEDSPYREIFFDAAPAPSLFDLDRNGLVAHAHTFSKTIGPGIRLGWIAWRPREIAILAKIKQTGACTLLSRAVASVFGSQALGESIAKARKLYRFKRDTMQEALVAEMPQGVSWVAPTGGFYFWLRLPSGWNVAEVCRHAAECNVLVLNGLDFFPQRRGYPALRLSFSFEPSPRILEGVRSLARVIGATKRR